MLAVVRAERLFSGPTGGSGGLVPGSHEVTLAGQPARIVVGTGYDPSRPTHLAYYLHGDEGGYGYLSNQGSALRQLIDRHGLIFVAPRAPEAPNQPGVFPWDGRAGGSQQGNAAQVRAVLDHLFSHYNVIRDEVLGAGASGGAWFHDAVFFPQSGADYPSHFILNAGAAGMRVGYFTYADALRLSGNRAAVAASRLKYKIGTADFLYSGAVVSAPTWSTLGIMVETEYLPGVGHGAFDIGGSIAGFWGESLRIFETARLSPAISHLPGEGGVRLDWKSAPGRRYTVQASAELLPGSPWMDLATVSAPPLPVNRCSFTDSRSPSARRFYRLRIEP